MKNYYKCNTDKCEGKRWTVFFKEKNEPEAPECSFCNTPLPIAPPEEDRFKADGFSG